MSEKTPQHEDEIELIDILRVIWKRKYLIMGGMLACGLIAAIISLSMPKTYMITMILEPVTSLIDDNMPENIRHIINSGAFNNDIINLLKKNSKDIPKSLNIKAKNFKKSNIIKVQYKSKDIATGLQILNILKDLLLKKYNDKVDLYKKSYDIDLIIKKGEISKYEAEQQTIKNSIINIEKRVDQLKADIKLLNKNTRKLVEKRDIIISAHKNQNSILAVILYNNMLQQNFAFVSFYKNETNDCLSQKHQYNLKLKETEENINILKKVISEINLQKDSIHNIQVIQSPRQSNSPVKPKMKLNIVLAIFVGGFIMIFVSFFVEYVSKFRINKLINNKEVPG
jgi:uncharacterized protein involved in exopolysaccharide biosynthesis